jgi:Flp pilus assembly protein TadB
MSEVLVGGGVALGAGVAAWYWWARRRLHELSLDRLSEPFTGSEEEDFVETPAGLKPGFGWVGPLLAVVVGLALHFVAGMSGAIAASISLALLVISGLMVGKLVQRRSVQLEEQLTESLDLIVASLHAGSGVLDALDTAAQEVREPLRGHLRDLVGSIRLGDSPRAALEDLSERVPLESFRLFTFALAVHEETGGSLAPTLATVARSVRDRIDIKRRIRSEVTQAQGSVFGILLITYAIGFVTWRTDPARVEGFMGSDTGASLFAAAVMLQAVGIYWMRRLTHIRH